MGPTVGALLLAAGGGARMGMAKQLLPYRGRTLLRHAAETLVASGCRPVVVVLGAHAARLAQELAGLPVRAVFNGDWEKGMGTSLRAGVGAFAGAAEAVVLALCDQPLVGTEVIRRLVEAHSETGKPVVASAYEGAAGAPALFHRSYFPRLLAVADGEGARRVIAGAGADCHHVPFPGGAFDVDTPQDYERLRAREERRAAPAATLCPPVGERDHVRGPASAPVTLVEYGDYECRHCGAAQAAVREVCRRVGGLRFVFRHFPLAAIHPHAHLAAEAAEAAAAQGKFWEMHDRLFARQKALGKDHLTAYAAALGLDLPRFLQELGARAHAGRAREDIQSGVRSGVNGTPTFFVNGARHDGPGDVAGLLDAVQEAEGCRHDE